MPHKGLIVINYTVAPKATVNWLVDNSPLINGRCQADGQGNCKIMLDVNKLKEKGLIFPLSLSIKWCDENGSDWHKNVSIGVCDQM